MPSYLNWDKLANRINATPLVICGPILRNTTKSEVTIWIALRAPATIKIELYNEGISTTTPQLTTAAVTADRFGEKLYVCIINVSSLSLSAATTYSYDLIFTPVGGHNYTNDGLASFNGNKKLGNNDILSYGQNGMSKLTYANSNISRPSFSLPPDDLNKVRMIHTSCRKPHGPSYDALEGLNDIIRDSLVNPQTNTARANSHELRPHQVFMTGDQIYADDVADMLLLMLSEASEVLMGWDETLTGMPSPVSPEPVDHYTAPGQRAYVSREKMKFTPEDEACKSHVWTLGEFYTMYLFVWSPELWDNTDVANNWHLPDFLQTKQKVESVATGYELKVFQDEERRITWFREQLDNVRRALANIPSWMIFDDHDVTDDWNATREWYNDAHDTNNNLGRQVLCNSMISYFVFQDWGNRPSYYTSGAGASLKMYALKHQFHATQPQSQLSYSNIADLVLPDYDTNNKHLKHKSGGMDWHYQVYSNPTNGCEVLVFDCRTLRGFPGGDEDSCSVIAPVNMLSQIPAISPSTQVTVLVSPGPIFGCPYLEFGKKTARFFGKEISKDVEDWAMRVTAIQELWSKLAGMRTIKDPGDSKYYGRIVVLSGDIHFAFTSRAQFWADVLIDQLAVGDFNLTMAHLTASAAKNESYGSMSTMSLHHDGYCVNLQWDAINIGDCLPSPDIVFGRQKTGTAQLEQFGTAVRNATSVPLKSEKKIVIMKPEQLPVVTTGAVTTASTMSVDWRYRVDYLMDTLEIQNREGTGPSNATINLGNSGLTLNEYLTYTDDYLDYANLWGWGKEIVGRNNIGEVRFAWPPVTGWPGVVHTLWWRLKGGDAPMTVPLPLTEHYVPLNFVNTDYPKPKIPQ